MKIFGSTAFVHNHDSRRTKLDLKAHKCIFVGYSINQRGYKCFDPVFRKMFVSMDVTFFEGQSYYNDSHLQGENNSEDVFLNDSDLIFESVHDDVLSKQSLSLKENEGENTKNTKHVETIELNIEIDGQPSLMPSQNQDTETTEMHAKRYKGLVYSKDYQAQKRATVLQHHQESNQRLDHEINNDSSKIPHSNLPGNSVSNSSSQLDLPIALRKGVRSCTKYPLSNFVSYKNVSSPYLSFISQVSSVVIPNNVQEALNVLEWKEAIFEEVKALEKNATWETVDLPHGKTIVGCKWVFTVKYNSDGSLERYKARLVTKGFTQTYGVDYSETFSIAKLSTI